MNLEKNILAKEGYLIHKKKNKNFLDKIKEELTVTPFMTFNKNIKVDSFPVYLENEKYLCVPKYYGIKNIGIPNINKEIEGEKNNIQFKGELRQKQQLIIDDVINKLNTTDGGLLCLGCGQGKCLGKNTPILMFDGTIKMVQDIIVGDRIMGDDSKPRTILSTTRGREMMYKIIDNYGYNESYIVNESHILSLNYNNEKIIDISLKDYLKLPNNRLYYGYRVPIIFPEIEIDCDPYIFGITCCINKCNIPYEFKCNSRYIQLKVLAGIIDTIAILHGYFYEIINENIIFLEDIMFISRSLGFVTYKLNENKIVIFGIGLEELPLQIIEKKWTINEKYNPLNYTIELEKLYIDDYYGFEIDGNRRFVLGDFTVTHNTVLSLYIATQLKVKTLVIVHKSFLLNQWVERAKQFTNANIGIIQQNKIDIDGKELVIGMLQSIAKDKYDYDTFRDFGLVIFDEAHHAPSKYFSRALPIIACKKTLALSATPNRADKLEKVLYWYFGDILYKAPIETINNVLVKIINYTIEHPNFKEYKINYGRDINRPKTINKLVEINKRNEFIIQLIKELLDEKERKILILSDRIEHLNILNKLLLDINIDSKFYIGGLKQKTLNEAEKSQILLASYSMAAEGLDIPDLNTLLMVTPRKEVEQAVGRITRRKDHPVQPLIIDFVDQLPSFIRQSEYRKKFYKKKDFIIKLLDVNNNEIINEKNQENIISSDDEVDFID
jgi:superfamily II DNA or RNA helicase